MQTDQKRHLEAGGTSGILRRILICGVHNKVWTQGQSEAAIILEKSNVEQLRKMSPHPALKNWPGVSPGTRGQIVCLAFLDSNK
ncbi:hypothetical protein NQZ68_000673 [Dissostichus eleginoides]|nr:hypothetical protein NQZ68_000673 [Dissostichus eleginoides]